MYYKDFSRHRGIWLGVAMLWMVVYHFRGFFGITNTLIDLGYGGVDICIFASGLGCYYSLSSDSDVVNFMKRRLKRLAPTYLIFIVVWLVYQYIKGNFGFQMAVGNLLAIQDFTGLGKSFNWYISAIFLLYILAPYFKRIVDRTTAVGKLLFFVFLLVCTIPFWTAKVYIITVTRIPVFYLGMLFADMCAKNKRITCGHVISMVCAFVLGGWMLLYSLSHAKQYLWSHGLYWYPFILITPPLCMAISGVSMILEKTKFTKPILSFLALCGDYSFEIYLVHVLLKLITPDCVLLFSLRDKRYLIWSVGSVLLFVGCFALRRAAKGVARLIGKGKVVK